MASSPTMPAFNENYMQDMSDKLLAGWTMLADVCPVTNCAVPLLRDRQKKVYCCKCTTFVLTEAEAQEKFGESLKNKSKNGASRYLLKYAVCLCVCVCVCV